MKKYFIFALMLLLSIGFASALPPYFQLYQESADVYNQGAPFGNPDGFLAVYGELNYSGSYYNPTGGAGAGFVDVTYIKPKYAVNTLTSSAPNGTVWMAKLRLSEYVNVSIPDSCWNANASSLKLRFYGRLYYPNGINPATAYTYMGCWNGASYTSLYSTSFNAGLVGDHWTFTGATGSETFDGDWDNVGFDLAISNSPYHHYAISSDMVYGGITEYAWFFEEALNWDVCVPQWVESYSSCHLGYITKTYTDTSGGFGTGCNSLLDLPSDNGTITSCSSTLCYQESSNTSNQAGTDTPNCGLIYSGSPVAPIGGQYLYENYTIPRTTLGSSILTVSMIDTFAGDIGIFNLSIPTSCLSGSKLQLEYYSNSYGFGDSAISCFNGSAFMRLNSGNVGSAFNGNAFEDFPTNIVDGDWSTSACSKYGKWSSYAESMTGTDCWGVRIREAGVWWNISCTERWVYNHSSCSGGQYRINYYDANRCGTSFNVPSNNGSIVSCSGLSSCYQESPSSSNQTGVDGSCSLNYSGFYDWTSSTSIGIMDIDYVKPPNSVGAHWIMKAHNNTYLHINIPQSCFDYSPYNISLMYHGIHYWGGGSRVQLWCYDGGWNTVYQNFTVQAVGSDAGWGSWNGAWIDGDWNTKMYEFFVAGSNWGWAEYSYPEQLNDPLTTNAYVWEEAIDWDLCTPNWVANSPVCSRGFYTKSYTDYNSCGVNTSLPVDNNTLVPCASTSFCYQESFNVSNQGAPSGNFDGSCGLNFSGWKFTTEDTNFDNRLIINYVKPRSASGGHWLAKVQNNTYLNLPIPQSCWDLNSSSITLEVFSFHSFWSWAGDTVVLSCANASYSLPYYSWYFDSVLYNVGYPRVANGGAWGGSWSGYITDGNWSTFDFGYDNGYGGSQRGVWSGVPQSYTFTDGTEFSLVYEEAMNWTICIPNWVAGSSVCNGVNRTISYYDSYSCGNSFNLPVDNGSVVSCLACSPNWVASYSPASCNLGYQVKGYIDQNYCGVNINLPFDNNTLVSCNIFSNISASHSVKLWDNFTMLAFAPVGAVVNMSVQYPSLASYFSSASWNGVAFESQSFNAYPNGTYVMSAYSLNQSISKNLVVTDYEAVIPTRFDSVLSAGSNFTFGLQIFTDSNYTLNHTITCIVPLGFTCIVPDSLLVSGNANATVIVTSDINLADDLYIGNLTVTRVLDGRSYSAVLPLGIASAFGVADITNPSQLVQIMYSNEVVRKNYTITNSGTYPLSECNVVVDGSFDGRSFVSGSMNFTVAPLESGIVTVVYTQPTSGIYTGNFNVFCKSTPSGLINGLSNPQFQQLFVIPYIAPYVPVSGGGGGGSPYVMLTANATTQVFSLLNSGGSPNGYVSYSYPDATITKTFVVQNKLSTQSTFTPTCLGEFCQYVTFSKASIVLEGFATDYFTATVNVPETAPLDGIFSYQVVLTDNSGHSSALTNSVHISSLSRWYSKFSPVVKVGDNGFWFSIGSFAMPKLLLYLFLVLVVDFGALAFLPKSKFVQKNLVLILTFVSLAVFGLSALIY